MDRSHYLRPAWIAHENTARHWAAATIAVSDMGTIRRQFEGIYGITLDDDAPVAIAMGDQRLSAVEAGWFADRHGDAARRADGTVAELAVEIRVASLDMARAVLTRNGVAFDERDDQIVVPAWEAGGIVLCFAGAVA